MKVAVVKYNAGNIRSVDYALKRLGVEAVITADKEELQSADKVIFPGVGEAETTMNHLKATGLDELIKNLRQPVFRDLSRYAVDVPLFRRRGVDCLNIFDVDVKRFVPQKHEDKVPHMGWNTIGETNSKLFEGFTDEEFVYFVHSFMCRLATLPLLRLIIFIRLVPPYIKITFMPPSFIRRKAVRRERGF